MITYDFKKVRAMREEDDTDEKYTALLSSIFPFAENKKIYLIKDINVEFHNGNIEIYNSIRKCAVISRNINNIFLTEAMLGNMVDKEVDTVIKQTKDIGISALIFMEGIKEIETEQTVKTKIKKLKNYTQVDVPSLKIRYIKYDNEGPFDVVDKGNGIYKLYIPCRNTTLEFPTLTYPLPNVNPRYFYSKNTEKLEDETVSNLLDDVYIRLGMCYDNSSAIYKALKEKGYTKEHKVDIYAGWLIPYLTAHLHIAFHCWLVIDDKYVIDTTTVSNTIKRMQEAEKRGQMPDIKSREDFAKSERDEMDANIPFSEKYTYGKVSDDFFYIGSKVESTDSAKQYAYNLWNKFPYHPSFSGMNKDTGNNKLHDIARQLENR